MLERVFLQVLRLSILACPLFLAILVMRLALRRAPRWVSCALWALLAVRLVCPFSLPSALSLQPSQARIDQTVAGMTRSSYDLSDAAPVVRWADITDSQTGEDIGTAAASDSAVHAATQPDATVQTGPAQTPDSEQNLLSRTGLLSVIWLAGVGAMVLYGLISWLRLRGKVRTAVRWYDDLWQCETVDTPFVMGLIRPRVYLPFRLDPASAAQIIAHEHAHIRRRDPWTKLFAYALLVVYWFDPAVWVAYWLLGRDMELACDERVIRDLSLDARQKYASALLEWGTEKPTLPVCPLAFGEVGVGARIIKVMKYKKPARWAAALAAVLAVAAAVCFLTDPAAEAAGDGQTISEPPAPIEETAAPEATPAPVEVTAVPEVTPAPVEASVPAGATPAPVETTASATTWYQETLLGAEGNIAYEIDAPMPAAAPETASVLTVKPRDFTVEEVQALVKAIFGDAEIYEYAEGSEYNQQAINALLTALGGDEAHTPEALTEKYIAGGMDPDLAEQNAATESELYTSTIDVLRKDLPTLPETADLSPCEWTFYPEAHYNSNYAGAADTGHRYLQANAWLDGLSYRINVCNKPVTDNAYYRANTFAIWADHDSSGLIPYEPFSDADADATLDTVRRYLADAGLDKYQIAEVYETGYSGGLTVICLPVYEGLRQAYMQDVFTAYDEGTGRTTCGEYIEFAFCAPGRLLSFYWYTPQEVVAIDEPQPMLSFDEAMDVFQAEAAKVPATVGVPVPSEDGAVIREEYPRDTFTADDIVFGYTRMTVDGAAEEYALVPCWALLGRNDQAIFHGPLLVISAVNGTVIRTVDDNEEVKANVSLAIEPLAGDTAAPLTQVTPTPRPQIMDLEVRWGHDGAIDYTEPGYFGMPAGSVIDLVAIWYPQVVDAAPEWTVDDPGVVAVQPDETGINCHCEMVGQPGDETTLHVKVNEAEADILVIVM